MNQKTEPIPCVDICKEETMYSKIVGVTFEGRQLNIPLLKIGMVGYLQREPNNKYDSNAVKFMIDVGGKKLHLGYIARKEALDFAEAMDRGIEYLFRIEQITGTDTQNQGINVLIMRSK